MKKAVSLFIIFLFSTVIWVQNRYALVIGNANYPSPIEKLTNAINDTNDISAALKKLGYEVVLKQNLKYSDMDKEVDAFIARLKNNRNSEGFFWYAGHAINEKWEGYLLPLDVDMGSITRVIKTSLSVTNLSKKLDDIHNKANVLVLDACRTPPKIKDEEDDKGRGMGEEVITKNEIITVKLAGKEVGRAGYVINLSVLSFSGEPEFLKTICRKAVHT